MIISGAFVGAICTVVSTWIHLRLVGSGSLSRRQGAVLFVSVAAAGAALGAGVSLLFDALL